MDDVRSKIGARIRRIRQERPGSGGRVQHMTIEELAEKAERSPNFVTKLERGKHSLSADALVRVAAALDVPPARLLDSDGQMDGKDAALESLLAFASGYSAKDIEHFIEVLRVVARGL